MTKRRALVAKLCVAVALCFFAAAGWLWHYAHTLMAHHWTPLRRPLQLRPGVALSVPLSLDLTGNYVIALGVDRRLSWQEAECLFSKSSPKGCGPVTPIDGVSWQLHDGQTLVASGVVEGERGWDTEWGRFLGMFSGTAGVTYMLKVESGSELPELNSLGAIVTVAVDRDQLKNHVVNASLSRDAALVLTVLGVITLGFGWRASRPLPA